MSNGDNIHMRIKALVRSLAMFGVAFMGLGFTVNAEVESVPRSVVSGNTISEQSTSAWDYAEPGQSRIGKPVILDMDFCSDVDDAVALRVAANLHTMGIIDLKGVSLCTSDANDINLKAANGMLNYSGLGHIPLGKDSSNTPDTSPYWYRMAGFASSNRTVVDSVKLWRSIIANSDKKVDIITTGYLTNLQNFMQSPADEISSKTGMELFLENVGNVYITGGAYTGGMDNNFYFTRGARESLDWILKNSPKSLIFITNDVGGPLNAGHAIQKQDKEKKDPLTIALYDWGTNCGRVAWDPVAVYIGGMINNEVDLETYKFKIQKIDMEFDVETGWNKMAVTPLGKHYRIYRATDDYEYYNQALEKLTIVSR